MDDGDDGKVCRGGFMLRLKDMFGKGTTDSDMDSDSVIGESSADEVFFTSLDSRRTFRSKDSMDVFFRKVSRRSVGRLLDDIDGYVENPRYRRSEFEKYLKSRKGIDSVSNSMFYGMFGSGRRCLALAYLNRVPEGFVLIAEVQSVFKGCGRMLIDHLLSTCGNIWWAADPSAKSSLVSYYRTFLDRWKGLREKRLPRSKFSPDLGEELFFYRCRDKRSEREIRDYIDSFAVKRMSFPRAEWPEIRRRVAEGRRIVTHRVSDDADRFDVGDTVSAEIGSGGRGAVLRVVGRRIVRSVSDSPYAKRLTDAQRRLLSRFRKIAVLTLEPD